MPSVAIHPPKTPVTKGSRTLAKATIPNVCKMPGPPAPFVPTPLPNIAKSELSPQGYSRTVKIEGKNVHLLGDPMLNNCGPSGSPPNTGATMMGADHLDLSGGANPMEIKCADAPKNPKPGTPKFNKCEKEELCRKCHDLNQHAKAGTLLRPDEETYTKNRRLGNNKCKSLNAAARKGEPADLGFSAITPECDKELRQKAKDNDYKGFSPDHINEIQLGGHPSDAQNLRWMSSAPNSWIGGEMSKYDTATHTGVKPDCCD